jgi:hypothetical protein
MKMWDRGKWKLRVYPWHSINLIPHLSMAEVGETIDDTGQALWLTVLGVVITITVPSKRPRYFSMKQYGPLWSRRRKVWYRADQ